MTTKETNSALSSPTLLLGSDGTNPGTVTPAKAKTLLGQDGHGDAFLNVSGISRLWTFTNRIGPWANNVISTGNFIYYAPVFFDFTITGLTKIGCYGTAVASSTFYLALYNANSSILPTGAPIADSGSISGAAATGIRTATVASFDIARGWYVLAWQGSAGGNAPNLHCSYIYAPWGACGQDMTLNILKAATFPAAFPTSPDLATSSSSANDVVPTVLVGK